MPRIKAFRGDFVPQDPNDEPACELLLRIREQREAAVLKEKMPSRRTRKAIRKTRLVKEMGMDLNDLLREVSIDPDTTLVLRHRPKPAELRRVLPWLAVEKPEVFNAYQQTQGPKVEKQMLKASHVASFIGHEPGRAQ